MLNFKSIKTQLIICLVSLAIFLAFKDRDPRFLVTIIIAIASSLTVESVLKYLKTKSLQITESSIVTGLIVGYVLSSDEAWWKFVLASALAILSKYLIRFRKKHIFNPAACGIFLILVFGASSQWRGTYYWQVFLPFGVYFALKIRKIEIIISYVVVSLGLFGIQAIFQRVPLQNIFGYLSYFFIFIMVIEPMTSPFKSIGKFIFGAGVAGLIFIFTELGVKFDVELFCLLVMNAAVPLLNRLPLKKEA